MSDKKLSRKERRAKNFGWMQGSNKESGRFSMEDSGGRGSAPEVSVRFKSRPGGSRFSASEHTRDAGARLTVPIEKWKRKSLLKSAVKRMLANTGSRTRAAKVIRAVRKHFGTKGGREHLMRSGE